MQCGCLPTSLSPYNRRFKSATAGQVGKLFFVKVLLGPPLPLASLSSFLSHEKTRGKPTS